jgi:ribonuclease HIII
MSPENDIPQDLRLVLDEWGVRVADHREIDHATQYYLERSPESVLLNVYSTGRVVVQGKNSGLRDLLAGRVAAREERRAATRGARPGSRPALDGTPRVGIDEAGKGDYFGPLVVAGVRVMSKEAAEELQRLGVRDSKTLGDNVVQAMAPLVLGALGSQNVHVVALSPREYEARREAAGSNVNRLLDEIDAEIIGDLKDGIELVVVDQYATSARERLKPFVPEGVRLEVRQKAEDDAAVAAASVVARARQLEEMDRLSERVGFELPKGATHVLDSGRRIISERGKAGLEEVAKTSFRITKQIESEVEFG